MTGTAGTAGKVEMTGTVGMAGATGVVPGAGLSVGEALEAKRSLVLWWESPAAVVAATEWSARLKDVYRELVIRLKDERNKFVAAEEWLDRIEERFVSASDGAPGPALAEVEAELERYQTETAETIRLAGLRDRGDPYGSELETAETGIVGWCADRAAAFRRAKVFWVSEPMVGLVSAAYRSMPGQPLRPEDLPAPDGLVVFQGPPRVGPAGDPSVVTADGPVALSWETMSAPASPGAGPTPGIRLVRWFARDTDLGASREIPGERPFPGAGPWVSFGMFWPFGQEQIGGKIGVQDAHDTRWFAAMCSLMGRPVVVVGRAEPDRRARRRAERDKIDSDVTVIVLRSAAGPGGGAPGTRKVDWKSRWLVAGFWRQQWYPVAGEHRAIWIDEYVKGPADRPLRIREHVYAWRR